MRRSPVVHSFCSLFYRWRVFRPLLYLLIDRLEGGVMFSKTWRYLAFCYHKVTFGDYSYGVGLKPGELPPGTIVGRFCSIAEGLKIFRRNHPVKRVSTHPLFFNAELGLIEKDSVNSVEANPLTIGNDVWIGTNVTILPGCRSIGDGAVIAACSVVTRDVEAFTVVAGNPARVIAKRFPCDVEVLVKASNWWEKSLDGLLPYLEVLSKDLDPEGVKVLVQMNAEDALSRR
jgi:virginiamycin A acetyltransferase